MDNQSYEYEEISIKELIQTLLDGKKIIAGITIFTVLLAFVFTFYVQSPKYESKTTILATNVSDKVNTENIEDMKDYINNLSLQTSNTLETYKQQIKSHEVLKNVIDNLELDKEIYTIDTLMRMVSVNLIKDTNLIEISVKSSSPKKAELIANGVSKEFINFINELNENKVNNSVEFLEVKINEQDAKLKKSMKDYETFLIENNSIDTIRNEIGILLENQKSFKSKLENLKINYDNSLLNNDLIIKKTRNNLNEVKSVLKTVDEKLEVNKNVIGNDVLREVLLSSSLDINDLSSISLTEESYNDNYLALEAKKNTLKINLNQYINNKKIITEKYNREKSLFANKVKESTDKLEKLQVKLAEMEHKNQLLNNKIENDRQTYELLVNKYDEIKVTESVKAGEMNLVINSKAYASQSPVSPNKKLNIAIALVLGLMVGVFIVFFISMWKEEK